MTGGPDHLAAIQNLLGCRIITAMPFGDHDTVYCDDEGLCGEPVYQFFGVKGYPNPVAGRGLVVGIDDEGYDTTPRATLAETKARTFFIERLFRNLWGIRAAERLTQCEIAPLDHITATLTREVVHG
ncbi:MAG: hypothetical protein APF80_11940 [Alphaproteobacteria bacterium BRH_c36]|nr:MAG: hypothetical protein APF80_11940 [Alphaproteobacteria bacterium BRH_c36]